MSLYNLKSADGDWRITKFTNELDPEGSYLVSSDACTCPAGVRPTCRHRQMLPKFLAAGAEDSGMFFHFETEQFLTPDLGESNSSSDLQETDDSSADSEVEFAENVSAELYGEIQGPDFIRSPEEFGRQLMAKDVTPVPYPYVEETCPGHVASSDDPKICGRCGTHIDSLRPDDELCDDEGCDHFGTPHVCNPKSTHPQGTIRRRL